MRNRARPEGSIAAGYLVEECLTFCSGYLKDTETNLTRPVRNNDVSVDDETPGMGRARGAAVVRSIPRDDLNKAHRCILFNTEAVAPFLE